MNDILNIKIIKSEIIENREDKKMNDINIVEFNSIPKDFFLIFCTSTDYCIKEKLPTTIKKNIAKLSKSNYPITRTGECYVTYATDWISEFGLVVSNNKKEKPNSKNITKALFDMRDIILRFPTNQHKIAISEYVCNIMSLTALEYLFYHTDIEFLIYKT